MTVAYLTDLEGRWDKLASFVDGNPHVALVDDRIVLADGVTFVFGGDAIDRGPHGRKIVQTLLAAHRTYGDRVVLLAGNRDINKLRLVRELRGEPPPGAPDLSKPELLQWIFARTMGARNAFEHRRTELATTDDNLVVQSFLDDVSPTGELRTYLHACRLAYRHGTTLFLHGGATPENFGVAPAMAAVDDADQWIANLEVFYRSELASPKHIGLIAYQAPLAGTIANQTSVVYGRMSDEHHNPSPPDTRVIERLRAAGIQRLVVGHTPSGDCPAIVRSDDGFELVLGDNSYGRNELGSQLAITDATTHVRGSTVLDDGSPHAIDFTLALDDRSTEIGKRLISGQLVKARLIDGRYLLFRGLPDRRVSQVAAPNV